MNDKPTSTPLESPSSDEDMRAEYDFSAARKTFYLHGTHK